jgi:hypothetical protein
MLHIVTVFTFSQFPRPRWRVSGITPRRMSIPGTTGRPLGKLSSGGIREVDNRLRITLGLYEE